MAYSDYCIGGYEFSFEELCRIAHERFQITLERGPQEGIVVSEIEINLYHDVIRLAPDFNGPYRFVLVSKGNKTGRGFPFEETTDDMALHELAKRVFDLDCKWVTIRNPATND